MSTKKQRVSETISRLQTIVGLRIIDGLFLGSCIEGAETAYEVPCDQLVFKTNLHNYIFTNCWDTQSLLVGLLLDGKTPKNGKKSSLWESKHLVVGQGLNIPFDEFFPDIRLGDDFGEWVSCKTHSCPYFEFDNLPGLDWLINNTIHKIDLIVDQHGIWISKGLPCGIRFHLDAGKILLLSKIDQDIILSSPEELSLLHCQQEGPDDFLCVPVAGSKYYAN
ncbi:MAG: hypothetical protein GY754_28790 [bacterium]|nr:hypothetical protein [bacterium]